jgi:hypothetical protein
MDDIRRPGPQRRDFAMRDRGYTPRQPVTDLRRPAPVASPAPSYSAFPPAQAAPQPAPAIPQPAPRPYEESYSHYTPPAPTPAAQPQRRRNPLRALPVKYSLTGAAVAVLISAAGFMLTRPAKTSGFTESELAKKASFAFFYPQPMPSGYVYEQKFNAFQDGQVYFMLAKGGKHIVLHEQAAHGPLDISSLTAARKFKSASGEAVIGYQGGLPAAKILAGTTLISANSTGPVSQDELARVLDQLKVSH